MLDLMVDQLHKDVTSQIAGLNQIGEQVTNGEPCRREELFYMITSTIPHNKWLWSYDAGHDIGTPETVKRMLGGEKERNFFWGQSAQAAISPESPGAKHVRDMLIVAYLLGFKATESILSKDGSHRQIFVDGLGIRPLEGEVQRWEARELRLPELTNVPVTLRTISAYCREHNLGGYYATLAVAHLEPHLLQVKKECAQQTLTQL